MVEAYRKVLVYNFGLAGGAGANVARISTFVAKNGFEVHLYYSRSDLATELLIGNQVKSIRLKKNRNWKVISSLAKAIATGNYNLVFVSGGTNAIVLVLAMKIARKEIPLIIRESNSPRGLLSESSGVVRKIKSYLTSWVYTKAKRIICVSADMKEELHRLWGVPKENLELVYNGVDLSSITQRLEGDRVRRKEGEAHTLLTVGRLTSQKDHRTLLHAFAQLERFENCRLIIVGSGVEGKSLRLLAQRLGIVRRVKFAGFCLDPTKYYRESDLFIMSSRFEGFPNVLIEAMAHGLPIVSTDCPTGPREILNSECFGRLVSVNDPTAMARAIESVLLHPPCKENIIERARAFSMDIQLNKYLKIFQSIK